jgi:hypothetical protein
MSSFLFMFVIFTGFVMCCNILLTKRRVSFIRNWWSYNLYLGHICSNIYRHIDYWWFRFISQRCLIRIIRRNFFSLIHLQTYISSRINNFTFNSRQISIRCYINWFGQIHWFANIHLNLWSLSLIYSSWRISLGF